MTYPKTLLLALGVFLFSATASAQPASAAKPAAKQFRIAHVMSYHIDKNWTWSTEQHKGFVSALHDMNVEVRLFEMDTKRKPSPEWRESVGHSIRAELERFKPDLIYLSDDNAQQHVGRYLVGGKVPVVFGGVNADPAEYGYTGAANVTGVLEREPIIESVKLVRELAPKVRRVVVLTDTDKTWVETTKRFREQMPAAFPDIELVTPEPLQRFEDYKALIKKYANTPTAFATLGVHTLKDETGAVVPFEAVMQWTAQESPNPEFTFYETVVEYGALCGVRVSGVEQGRQAALLAKQILLHGKQPNQLPVVSMTKGHPALNLARAKSLGIKPTSTHLLSAVVAPKMGWTKPAEPAGK